MSDNEAEAPPTAPTTPCSESANGCEVREPASDSHADTGTSATEPMGDGETVGYSTPGPDAPDASSGDTETVPPSPQDAPGGDKPPQWPEWVRQAAREFVSRGDGATVTEVAKAVGYSRQALTQWMSRPGWDALVASLATESKRRRDGYLLEASEHGAKVARDLLASAAAGERPVDPDVLKVLTTVLGRTVAAPIAKQQAEPDEKPASEDKLAQVLALARAEVKHEEERQRQHRAANPLTDAQVRARFFGCVNDGARDAVAARLLTEGVGYSQLQRVLAALGTTVVPAHSLPANTIDATPRASASSSSVEADTARHALPPSAASTFVISEAHLNRNRFGKLP